MKLRWNKEHPDAPIVTNDPRDIHARLKDRLSDSCTKESCWMKQDFLRGSVDSDMKDNTFAPPAPDSWEGDPWEWLSSVELEDIMKQYEHKYPCFSFIGPTPVDFDEKLSYGECVWDELCKFNLKSYIDNKKKKIGIIFNLDPHHKGGSHWVAMFVDIPKRKIHYFDSNGDHPPRRIKKLVKRISEQGEKLGMKFGFSSNHPISHQRRNSECGMYTLYFIIEMIRDKPFRHFKNKKLRIKDKYMNSLRRKWFN